MDGRLWTLGLPFTATDETYYSEIAYVCVEGHGMSMWCSAYACVEGDGMSSQVHCLWRPGEGIASP